MKGKGFISLDGNMEAILRDERKVRAVPAEKEVRIL